MSPTIITPNREKEAEVLSSQVRSDGVGEDKVIQDLLSDKFVKGTNEEALGIALALQQLIRGQNSMLANQDTMSAEIAKLKEKMAQMDEDGRKWDENREKFIQDTMDKADKLRWTGPEGERKKAQTAAKTAEIYKNAIASASTEKIQFKAMMEARPKVTVSSPGKAVIVRVGQSLESRILPTVIKIKNMTWVIPPGIPTAVPDIVAERLRQIEQQEAASGALKGILNDGVNQDTNVADKLVKLQQQTGMSMDDFPLAEGY